MNSFLKEFKDPEISSLLNNELLKYADRTYKIMELCGTHTMSLFKSGVRAILPPNIKLISGPGCPVCVTPNYYMDNAVKLAMMKDVIVTTFGDLMRVPGNGKSLLEAKTEGADARVVYSPMDSLAVAAENPDKKVVFLSVGFETTTPIVALAVKKAKEEGLKNFFILAGNKTMPAAIELLSCDKDIAIDGFFYPGHVCSVAGTEYARIISKKYGIPGVVAGFEPVDLLYAILELVKLINEGNGEVKNLYSRVVREEGNPAAYNTMFEVFQPCDTVWRGIGNIPASGLELRDEYVSFDAWKVFNLEQNIDEKINGCICGEILKGIKEPSDCPLFAKKCTPNKPVGACMVSSEGSCAAHYKYGRNKNV